jgi:ABC-type Fe3+-siderophore transport system permease subunit
LTITVLSARLTEIFPGGSGESIPDGDRRRYYGNGGSGVSPFFAFFSGSVGIPPETMLRIILGRERDSSLAKIVWELRLPRIVMALLVGMMLAAGGTISQAVFRNPLAAYAGGVFLLFADILARTLLAPVEIPIGVVTAFFIAPFFLFLAIRRTGVHTGK